MPTVMTKQPEISEFFSNLIKTNRLQHAYIFDGIAGTGKYEMALWIAQSLYCQNNMDGQSPCLECNQCLRIQQGDHPDVTTLAPDGLSIKVDQVRAIKEEFSKSGMETRRKILIVKDMDKMTMNAANSLLKFIEEPEGEITIMLLTTEVQKLLPTIVSRAQIIHFPVRDIAIRMEDILEKGIPAEAATILAYLTQDADRAVEIFESEEFSAIVEIVWKWFLLLHKNKDQAFIYIQTDIMNYGSNRENASLILDLLILLYRDLTAICFEQERVTAFSKHEAKLREMASMKLQAQLPNVLTLLLVGKKKLGRYVAAQGVFEQIALNI